MSSRSKKKENTTKQQQDAVGISRKKVKFTFSPKLFVFIKLTLIALIPILYFVYSPLLIVDLILYIFLFFLARITEKTINKSVIKSNHIHIFKADSALALIIILIAIFGLFVSSNTKVKQATFANIPTEMMKNFKRNFDENSTDGEQSNIPNIQNPPSSPDNFNDENFDKSKIPSFKDMKKTAQNNQFILTLKNLGSLLTGERNIFSSKTSFGITEKPDNFISSSEEFQNLDENISDKQEKFETRKENFSMDNIPLEFMSSSTISSINTILIFSCAIIGLLSIVAFLIKQHKFNRVLNEVIFETKIEILDDAEIDRILSFGETTIDSTLSAKELKKKIKYQEKLDFSNKQKSNNEKTKEEIEFEKNLKEELLANENKPEEIIEEDNESRIL